MSAVLLVAVVALLARAPAAAAASQGGVGTPAAAAAAAAAAAGNQPEVTLVGRFVPGPDDRPAQLPQLFTWSGSSASVAFDGATAVAVVLNGSLAGLPNGTDVELIRATDARFPLAFFRFELDGVDLGVDSTSIPRPALIWIRGNLTTGRHVLTITKLSEAKYGAAWLQSIALSPGAHFLAAPPSVGALTGRRMLFIGDSYTAGWGNLAAHGCKVHDAGMQDVQRAYGPLTARALGADAQVLAWSGAGLMTYTKRTQLVRGGGWTVEMVRANSPTMGDLLSRAHALDPRGRYWQAGFKAQVVVLAAGTNDFYNTTLNCAGYVVQGVYGLPPGIEAWLQGYAALVAQVRRMYPQAVVINLVWPMEVLLAGVRSLDQTLAYSQYMAAAYSRLVQAGVRNTHLLQLSGEMLSSWNWCHYHPDATDHYRISEQLQQFIQAVVPGWQAGKKQGAT